MFKLHAIAQRRGATAETWDFYAQAHAPLLEGVDAALDAASAFGAAVLVASPMLTARERERAVTFAARGVLALATLHPLADRRVALFFLAYCAADLGAGYLDYRNEIHWESGWAHHTFYAFGILVMLYRGHTKFFTAGLVEEMDAESAIG